MNKVLHLGRILIPLNLILNILWFFILVTYFNDLANVLQVHKTQGNPLTQEEVNLQRTMTCIFNHLWCLESLKSHCHASWTSELSRCRWGVVVQVLTRYNSPITRPPSRLVASRVQPPFWRHSMLDQFRKVETSMAFMVLMREPGAVVGNWPWEVHILQRT